MSKAGRIAVGIAFTAGVLLMSTSHDGLQFIGCVIVFGVGIGAWMRDISTT
jgi:hypothetical protein